MSRVSAMALREIPWSSVHSTATEMGEMGYEFSRKQCRLKTKKLTHRHQIYKERRVASNVAIALGTQALSYNS